MTRKAWTLLISVFVLFLLSGAPFAAAQTATTGQISGTVSDPTGAVLVGVKVSLTSATGVQRETVTDSQGLYRFALLPPGPYNVIVEAPHFKPLTFDNVLVRITETSELNAELKVAGTAESVSVTGETPLVQTESPTAGRVISDAEIRQLPLPTRNFQQILALSPGAIANLANTTDMGRGDANIDVNGQRDTSNNVVVDGTPINSPGTNSTPNISVPSPDAIQEFIVQTSLYDATQGRNAGGNIAVVTKSGTNSFHGTLFEFFRDEALNANDYFLKRADQPRPILDRNQFGATFGGPIVKDKTYFFASYQGTREHNGTSLTNSLTTLLMPAGLTNDRSPQALNNLAAAYGVPLNSISEQLLQATLPNGQYAIPSAAPAAGAALTTPVVTPLSGVSTYQEDQFNVNVDHNLTSKNKLSGKFFFADIPQFQSQFSFVGANPFQAPGYGGSIDFHNRVFTLTDTHIFSPNLINEARFGFSRINAPSTPEEPFVGTPTNAAFGIVNPLCAAGDARFCGIPTIQVGNAFSMGSTPLADQRSTTNTFSASDMVSWTHGKHFFRFGGDVRRYQVNFFFNSFSRGQINFNSFSDFLQGNIAVALLGNGIRDRAMRVLDFDWYLQDDFRVTEKLTINYGARLERQGGISELHGKLANFDPAAFATNTFPCSVAAPCTKGFNILGPGQPINPNDWGVAPRFGFSYKPLKENLVVRGGFGVYFDRFSTRMANSQVFDYPFDIVGITLGALSGASFANPFPANLATTSFPVQPPIVPSPVTFPVLFPPFVLNVPLPIQGIYIDPNLRTPYVYQYNLGMQWELKRNWLLELGYVGTKGTKLIDLYNLNQGQLGTAPYGIANFSNGKGAVNGLQQVRTNGTSNYNSLQASMTKRFSNGLQFLASYTWSKSIDVGSGAPTTELAALPGDQQNLASMRGLSDFDRQHRFVFSGVYDLPKFFHGDSGAGRRLFNDWEIASITTIQTGLPFTVACFSGNPLLNRADLSGSVSPVLNGPVDSRLGEYFNRDAFNNACLNTAPYGTSPRNFLRGPAQQNVDLSIIKFVPVTESKKLEIRTEFFNAFNFVNFGNPISAFTPGAAGTFNTLGVIGTTSTGPRMIQFAMKFSF